MKYMSVLGWHSRFPICDLCDCECTGSDLRSSKRSTRIVAHHPRLRISSSISVSRKQTVSPQDLAIIAPSQGGALELYDDMVMRAIEFAKQMPNPTLKLFRILCHKHPSLETVAKDCITGTKMILDDDGKWDWDNDGRADSDDEEISSQEFSSTDSSSDVDS